MGAAEPLLLSGGFFLLGRIYPGCALQLWEVTGRRMPGCPRSARCCAGMPQACWQQVRHEQAAQARPPADGPGRRPPGRSPGKGESALGGAEDYVNGRDGAPCHGVCESASAGVSGIADCAEFNITFGGSEVFEPLDDVFAGVPAAFTFRAGSGRCAAFDRFAFHGHNDVLACGSDADVPEPGLDHAELDTGLETGRAMFRPC